MRSGPFLRKISDIFCRYIGPCLFRYTGLILLIMLLHVTMEQQLGNLNKEKSHLRVAETGKYGARLEQYGYENEETTNTRHTVSVKIHKLVKVSRWKPSEA